MFFEHWHEGFNRAINVNILNRQREQSKAQSPNINPCIISGKAVLRSNVRTITALYCTFVVKVIQWVPQLKVITLKPKIDPRSVKSVWRAQSKSYISR